MMKITSKKGIYSMLALAQKPGRVRQCRVVERTLLLDHFGLWAKKLSFSKPPSAELALLSQGQG